MAEPGADESAEVGRPGHDAAFARRPATNGAAMNEFLEPGMLVRHPQCPDWGLGQVQSVIGQKITVNFEHAGKVVIDGSRIGLEPDFGPEGSAVNLSPTPLKGR
jgi:hypothetical protein